MSYEHAEHGQSSGRVDTHDTRAGRPARHTTTVSVWEASRG